MIDYLHIASDKANLQRRVDAAVLGMVAEAMPDKNVTVDIDGTITSGTDAGKKVCEITTDIINRGIESLINAARSAGRKSTAEGYLKKAINLAENSTSM